MFTPCKRKEFLSTDYENGYECGYTQGRERCGRKLYDRLPPDHLTGRRRDQWKEGYRHGLMDRKHLNKVHVCWKERGEDGVQMYKSAWYSRGVSRKQIVSRLAEKGVCGDVIFTYYKDGEKAREVLCGI